MYMGHHKAETAESLDLLQQWRKIPMVCRKTEGRKRKMGEPKGTKRKKRKESPEAKEGGSTEKPSDQVECCSSWISRVTWLDKKIIEKKRTWKKKKKKIFPRKPAEGNVFFLQKSGWTSTESESSSEDENGLTILSENEEDDETLAKKRSSAPFNFTVKNVRSLLKVCDCFTGDQNQLFAGNRLVPIHEVTRSTGKYFRLLSEMNMFKTCYETPFKRMDWEMPWKKRYLNQRWHGPKWNKWWSKKVAR